MPEQEQATAPTPDSPKQPMNPEQANVQLNQQKIPPETPALVSSVPKNNQTPDSSLPLSPKPVVPTIKSSPSTKLAADKKTPNKKRFILGCAGLFLGLFVVFILLIVAVLAQAGESNPVLQTLKIDPASLRSFLSGLIAVSFGSLAVLFLVLTVIGFFRLIGSKKEDRGARSAAWRMTFFSLMPFILVVFIWFALVNFISRLNLDVRQVRAEILVLNHENLENLRAPVEVTFSALGVATNLASSGLAIESMDWDLDGDGNYETPITPDQPQITRLYNRRGTFNVGLRAKVSGEEEYRVFYKPIAIIDATFAADPDTGTIPLEVRFDATDILPQGRTIQNLSWDFDADGKYDLEGRGELTPRFTFTEIGTYQVHLRLIDEQNNVENYYRQLKIDSASEPLLTAVIEAEPGLTGTVPFALQFDGGGSKSLKGNIVNYRWNFGDGSAEQLGRNVSHVFNTPGIFQVTLTVTDDAGRTVERVAEVEASLNHSAPQAVIKTIPQLNADPKAEVDLVGMAPFKVNFDASDSTDIDQDIVDYKWDFNGDSKEDDQGQTAEYTFTEPGLYEVTLTVIDAQGQEGESVLSIEVQNPGLQASIQANPVEGVAPLVVQFDGSASSAFEGRIVSYKWDFGDQSAPVITGASVTHKYDQVGQYTSTLTVTTDQNKTSSTTLQIFVRQVSLQACFTPSRTNGIAPLSVSFDPKCTTGDAQFFEWDFGDGGRTSTRSPVHAFESPGTYTVTLQVSDKNNNVSSYQQEIIAEAP